MGNFWNIWIEDAFGTDKAIYRSDRTGGIRVLYRGHDLRLYATGGFLRNLTAGSGDRTGKTEEAGCFYGHSEGRESDVSWLMDQGEIGYISLKVLVNDALVNG